MRNAKYGNLLHINLQIFQIIAYAFGFNFEYLPEKWDGSYLNEGKAHVWQKLNPITGRQYDYHGVMLCPREPSGKGRPKYIMEPACTQREYPVYQLDANKDMVTQLEKADQATKSGMYWVVDKGSTLVNVIKERP
mgnify:CR=1 FL=1